MPLDLVGSKIMTVCVAEIEGRGTGALHANNGSDAKRFARDRLFATVSWSWRGVIGYAVGSQSDAGSAPAGFMASKAKMTRQCATPPVLQHKKIAEATCRRILASTVPNYIQPRPVIVPGSSLYRARLGA
jgi:hypothetical protein